MKRMMIMVLGTLIACLTPINAQTFRNESDQAIIQSQQVMNGGAVYQGTVYEPFSSAMPSEQGQVGSAAPYKNPGSIRRTESQSGRTAGEATEGSEESPLGDAVWPLMLMALAYLGVRVFRARKRA